jgi:WD40 repeat protein
VIAVWDSSLEYLVLVYSPDGRLIERYSAYEGALGIKSVAFSPSSQFLALGSFDSAARLLNALTWRPIQNFHLPASASPAAGLVYVERDLSGVVQAPVADEHAAHAVARSSYELLDADAPAVRVEVTKAEVKVNPRMGVGLLAWAPDSSLLATRSDEAPNVLWVWSASTLALSAALVQLAPIKDAKWSPVEPRLALCGGGRNVYLWTPEGASCIEVPLPNLCVHTLDWAPDGRALILRDHDAHSVAFVTA